MSIDWTKPIRTVSRHDPVRVLAIDIKSPYPVVIAIDRSGNEYIDSLTLKGSAYEDNNIPYVENIPEEKFVWFNVYERPLDENLWLGVEHHSKDEAIKASEDTKDRLVGRNKFKLERRFDE